MIEKPNVSVQIKEFCVFLFGQTCVRFCQVMVFVPSVPYTYKRTWNHFVSQEWGRGVTIFHLSPILRIPSASRACNPAGK